MSNLVQRQRLDDKVAIITGATGRIGEATARLFLDLGARVMLVSRSANKLAAARGRIEAHGEVGTVSRTRLTRRAWRQRSRLRSIGLEVSTS